MDKSRYCRSDRRNIMRYQELVGTGEKDEGWKGNGMAEMERLDRIVCKVRGVGTIVASGVERELRAVRMNPCHWGLHEAFDPYSIDSIY